MFNRLALRVMLGALLLALNAGAALIRYPLPELVAQSEIVVRGTVTHMECRWGSPAYNPERRVIMTDVVVETGEWLKGTADGNRVLVEVEGGVIGDQGCWVEDEPEFAVGDEVVLLLSPVNVNGRRNATNFYQGKYTVFEDGIRETGGPKDEFLVQLTQAIRDER